MGLDRLAALGAAATLLLGCSPATSTPAKFDLVCQGQLTGGRTGDIPGALRIRIDAAAGRFCLDDLCAAFSHADAARLEYHCVAGKTFCKPAASSGGPFVTHEDLVIERAGWKVTEASSGTAGDPAAVPFSTRFTGQCQTAPFTGMPPAAK